MTALDPSGVALERAETAAHAAGVDVTWIRAGLLGVPGGTGQHDLVSAQYTVLRRTDDDAAITTLLAAVAPGGTLLVVHHDLGPEHAHEHFDPDEYVLPDAVAAHLDDGWDVEVHEVRPRPEPSPAGAHRVGDVVVRARRHPGPADETRTPVRG